MMKVIIIDDEPLARSIVREYLEQHQDINIVAERGDGFAGVKAIAQHEPDLIFLDIQMKRLDGLATAERIRERDEDVYLVFITNLANYAIRGYAVHALDFILKPVNFLMLRQVLMIYSADQIVAGPVEHIKMIAAELIFDATVAKQEL